MFQLSASCLVESVTGHFQGNGTISSGNNIVYVESIGGGSVNKVVDCVTLVDSLHESINRHGLLPELKISDQFVALSVVAEGNIEIVLLRNDNISHDSFSLVSTGLDLLTIDRGGLSLDSHIVQGLQQSGLVEELGLDGTEVTVQGGGNTGIVLGRSECTGAGRGNGDDSGRDGLHGDKIDCCVLKYSNTMSSK